jgi:hypothetical protein
MSNTFGGACSIMDWGIVLFWEKRYFLLMIRNDRKPNVGPTLTQFQPTHHTLLRVKKQN